MNNKPETLTQYQTAVVALDIVNAAIQAEIVKAAPDLQRELARIKFDINKAFNDRRAQ